MFPSQTRFDFGIKASPEDYDTARCSQNPDALRWLAATTSDTEIFDILMENKFLPPSGWVAILNSGVYQHEVLRHSDAPEEALIRILESRSSREYSSLKAGLSSQLFEHPQFSQHVFDAYWGLPGISLALKVLTTSRLNSPFLAERHVNDYAENTDEDIVYQSTEGFFRWPSVTTNTVELLLSNPVFHPETRRKAVQFLRSKMYPGYPTEWVEALYELPAVRSA